VILSQDTVAQIKHLNVMKKHYKFVAIIFHRELIGIHYVMSKDNSAALHHFQESLQIHQRSIVSNHRDLGVIHSHLAGMYTKLHNLDQAVKHARP
jgi:hypothetical protein